MNQLKKEPRLNLFHLAWPMFIEELTAGITGFSDTFFISMISDEAAGAVGMLGSVLMLGYFILPQFTSAGTSVASQYIGAKRQDRVVPAWIANILISAGMGAVLAFAIFAMSGHVGLWLGMTPSQNGYAGEYLSIIAFNFILVGLRASYGSILASQTLTRWNMVASVVTNLLNIPLNWALMKGFWIIPAMGVRGVALATVISYVVGFLILFYMVHVRLKVNLFVKGIMKDVREVVLPILKIGVPAALEPLSYTVQSFVVSYLIIGLGTVAMGANTYLNRFTFLDGAASWSLTMGGQILMSHYLGAGRIDDVRKAYWKIAAIISSFAFAVMLVVALGQQFFLGLFTKDPEIIRISFWLFILAIFIESIRSINILGGVALKTVGDGKFSVVIGLVFMWGLVPVILLSSALGFGIIGLWCCLLLDEVIRAGINIWRWKSGKWIGKRVIG
jgi:putative MATE family efflux protein